MVNELENLRAFFALSMFSGFTGYLSKLLIYFFKRVSDVVYSGMVHHICRGFVDGVNRILFFP